MTISCLFGFFERGKNCNKNDQMEGFVSKNEKERNTKWGKPLK